MKRNHFRSRFFVVLLFLVSLFSFSCPVWAAENISAIIQKLENLRSESKERAEYLGARINQGDYSESMENELARIAANIENYNNRLAQLRQRQADEEERKQQALAVQNTPSDASTIRLPQEDSGLPWKAIVLGVILLVAFVVGAYSHYQEQQEARTLRPRPGVINQTFVDPNYRPQPRSTTSAQAAPASPERLRQGVNRLGDRGWQRSQAAQNGEIPPELL